jgi:hypothetical protein
MAEYAKGSRAVNKVVASAIIQRMDRLTWSTVCGLVCVAWPLAASAGTPPPGDVTSDSPEVVAASAATPPPLDTRFLQYGVSFTGEFVTDAGPMCRGANLSGTPCILGSGGGVAIRVGYRSAGPWYFGGAYELSRQNPEQLYRLATLQQLRGEARYYVPTGRDTTPYVSTGLGVAFYGNEWGADTLAPSAFLSLGAEFQVSRRTVVGVALAYRLMYFTAFTDSSGADRDAGIAQLVGLDLLLEARDPL